MESILEACKSIREKTNGFVPEVGIILGTGLGGFVDSIEVEHRIEYKDIPNMPVSTVEGHKGCLIFGMLYFSVIICVDIRGGRGGEKLVFKMKLIATHQHWKRKAI